MAIMVLVALLLVGGIASADSITHEVTELQMRTWVQQLECDSFHQREMASRKLVEHASRAAVFLTPLLMSEECSPEATWRGFEVLIGASLARDSATSNAATRELLKLSHSKSAKIASLASTSLQGWHERRRALDLNRIRGMGGEFQSLAAHSERLVVRGALVRLAPVDSAGDKSAATAGKSKRRDLADAFDAALRKELVVSARATAIARELAKAGEAQLSERDNTEVSKEFRGVERLAELRLSIGEPVRPVIAADIETFESYEYTAEFVPTVEVLDLPSRSVGPSTAMTPSPIPPGPVSLVIGSNWKGGEEGLAKAAEIAGVRAVVLREVKFTDAAIRYIAQIKDLQDVQIYKGAVSAAAYRALRKVRPELNLFATGEGYFGVNGSNGPPEGFRADSVTDGGGAQKAGIRDGDIIVTLNGIPIKDLGDISLFVFNRKAGYPFRAEVIRGGKRLIVEGKIGGR